jgi:hypothetical protein
VFFEWEYHTRGFLGLDFPAKKTTRVIFPLKKHTSYYQQRFFFKWFLTHTLVFEKMCGDNG